MKKQRYPLTRAAAMQVAYAEATNPRFHELLGHAIEFDRVPYPDAALIISAAQDIARENDQPCASTMAVIQQLRLRVNAGKLSLEDLQEANNLLDAVEDVGGVVDLEGLLSTVTPAIKSVATMDALEQTIQAVGQRVDPAEAAEKFAAVANLGKARVSMGSELVMSAADIALSAARTITDPLPTGITELDIALGGGTERASLGVFLGNSGDGKSLALCHVTTESLLNGRDVAYVTAELSEPQIKQRVYCNMFGMSAADLAMQPSEGERRGQALVADLVAKGQRLGRLKVLYLTPKVGTVSQVRQWLKDLAKATHPFAPEVLIVDYADKLAAKASEEQKGSYQSQGAVYQQLRDLVVEHNLWSWTASQTTGRQGRKKKLDIEDIADSMEKARICDTLVAIVRNDDDVQNGLCRFRLPKRRNGVAHQEVGPCTMDPERGRMVAVTRQEPW
jgi:KaiC/GvpD/RAD55 family RecA-like ATPase